jgi:hypothetical protein
MSQDPSVENIIFEQKNLEVQNVKIRRIYSHEEDDFNEIIK